MNVTNKIHRGTSLAAAIPMLILMIVGTLIQVLNLFRTRFYYPDAEFIKQIIILAITTFAAFLVIIALFRGRKDVFSGILFILAALSVFPTAVVGNITLVFTQLTEGYLPENMAAGFVAAAFISLFCNLVVILFRVLLAVECFNPGSLSRGKMKFLLIVLPIISIIATVIMQMVQNLYILADYDFAYYLSVALLPAIFGAIGSIPTVIMGLSLSIPVYQKPAYDYMYGAQQNYDYTCNN